MRRAIFAALALLLAAVPVRAQTFEVAAMAGYANPVALEQTTANVDDLTINGQWTFAGSGTWFLSEHVGVEGWYSHSPTSLRLESGGNQATLFEMTISNILGNFVIQPMERSAALQPFLFAGAGVAVFTARDFDTETKVAFTVGGGLKWRLTQSLAARVSARYRGAALNDSASTICNPFGFCQSSMNQVEVMGGVVVRF